MRHTLLVSIFTFWRTRLTATRPTGAGILSIVLALAASASVLVVTAPNGIALTPDSVGYIAAARSLSAGRGLTLFDSSLLTIQAPLYPTILSSVELITGLDPLEGARFVNAGLFGIAVYVSGILFRRRLARTSFVTAGMASVFLSPVLFNLSTYALTETLFILWTLIFLLLIDDYLAERSSARLILVAIVTGLACLTRYFGISLAVTGAAAVLFLSNMPFRAKLIHCMWFGAAASAPLGIWASRNFLLEGTPFGGRDPSPYPFHHNLYFSLARAVNWFFPLDYFANSLKYTRAHFILGAIAGYIAGSIWPPGNAWTHLRVAMRRTGPEILFFGVYTSVLVAASTITAHEGINDRYMSPVYAPAVLVFLYALERRIAGSTVSLTMQRMAFAILIVWLSILSLRTALHATRLMETGTGYNHIDWRTSETISYLQEQVLPGVEDIAIFSNNPEAVYILADVSASSSPEAKGYKSRAPRRLIASIAGTWPGSQPSFLVWFHSTQRDHLFAVSELEQIANLEVVRALTDGTIYAVSRDR